MGVDVVVPSKIEDHLNLGKVFIFDEYYHQLHIQKLNLVGSSKTLPAIFTIGLKEKLIIMTGHYSQGFKKFLSERFNGCIDYCLVDESDHDYLKIKLDLNIECLNDMQQL